MTRHITQEELDAITGAGIGADVKAMRRDMSSQFSDPMECFREFVVNSSDAGAAMVTVELKDVDKHHYQALITDDGHGMNRGVLRDMFMLFRSSKTPGEGKKVVGHHGVGVKSLPAAGQVDLEVFTSTATEAWIARAGDLLSDDPITVRAAATAERPGTQFRITLRKQKALEAIASNIEQVLRTYCSYLPVCIRLLSPGKEAVILGQTPWVSDCTGLSYYGVSYRFHVMGKSCEAVIELHDGPDEIYQGRVLVASKYSLLSFGADKQRVRGVRVRLDSSIFELPFGRHGLRNEEVLGPISDQLTGEILPRFVCELSRGYQLDEFGYTGPFAKRTEDICVQLMQLESRWISEYGHLPLFFLSGGGRISLNELKAEVQRHGQLFLEADAQAGIDYGSFDTPVLSLVQPQGGLKVVEQQFGAQLLKLNGSDLVMEAPKALARELSPEDQRFQSFLGLHPGATTPQNSADERETRREAPSLASLSPAEIEGMGTVCQEAEQALVTVGEVTWRVSYLVGRDGRTPCTSQRSIIKGDSCVVLNLNHREVGDLLRLSATDPLLAGHFALSMVLRESNGKFLEHLSPSARQDLLLADASARCLGTEAFENARSARQRQSEQERMLHNRRRMGARVGRVLGSFPEWAIRRAQNDLN